jgi:hypothetical protein
MTTPALGACSVCHKERLVLAVAKDVKVCDACSYVIREDWNDIKMLRTPAVDPKIAVTYFVIPRRHPSRSELDVSGYEFVTVAGGWPVTSYNPDRKELALWLLQTLGIVTWPKGMTRIYAGFDASLRFAEVVLLTLWGMKYDPPPKDEALMWRGFSAMLSPETTKGAFVIGAKLGFEGFLQRRELAPAATTECSVLSEMAVRYLAIKRGADRHPVYSSQPMVDVYFQGMSSQEKLLVGQLLGMSADEDERVPVVEAHVVAPDSSSRKDDRESQQSLDFEDSTADAETADDEADYEDDEDDEGETIAVRGPLEPKDQP